jgi:hypothetical protein
MQRVLAAEATIFFELQTLRGLLLVLISYVIAIFAIATLQYDVVSHNSFQFSVFSFQFACRLKTEN